MLQKVKTYIEQNQLIETDNKLIVGLSGGADSVAMLDVLLQLGYRCIAAHCNFHLRGDESNRDALFVKELCRTYHIPLHAIDFDTKKYAAEQSISIEMAARALRYNWFEELRQKENSVYIAVAHHRDDSIETVLLNLIRGTGIRGLTGIASRNGAIIRPLLSVSREEIIAYINEKNLSYVDDYTNSEDIYTRNRIRLKILPLLETINPAVRNAIVHTSQHLSQVQHIYDAYIKEAEKQVFDGKKIDITLLQKQLEPKAILFEILYKHHFNPDVIEQVFNSLDSQSGKVFYSTTYQLVKDRDRLLLSQQEESSDVSVFEVFENDISTPIHLSMEKLPVSNGRIEKNKDMLYLDYDKLQFPLKLRRWGRGDWFIPFGMKGKKKVSDYFSDNKFSLIDKENAWLLCNNDHIIWIVGHRSDDRYRITPTTKTILKITLSYN